MDVNSPLFGPVVVSILLGIAVLCIFTAVWRFAPRRDPMDERLAEYGLTAYVEGTDKKPTKDERPKVRFAGLAKLLNSLGMGPKVAEKLSRADIPLTVAEFVMIQFAIGGVLFALGFMQLNLYIGLVAGTMGFFLPGFYLNMQQGKLRSGYTNQLPDVLTLLVGSLRAGYGLSQALELVAREASPPANREFSRVQRAMSLGVSLQRALDEMAARVDSDDLDLVVTAINIQYEMGGNLANVLETISETIRDRIRIQREVQVLTAQQRLTGYILAFLPAGLSTVLALTRPGYFDPFFEPGLVRLLPIVGLGMMMVGFFLIQKIVKIEV